MSRTFEAKAPGKKQWKQQKESENLNPIITLRSIFLFKKLLTKSLEEWKRNC